jgi:glycine dehydrogenase subunit 2
MPIVIKEADTYRFATKKDHPQSIGRLSAFMGNAGILLRAYFYIRMLGKEGLKQVATFATLNANYLMSQLKMNGFELAYPSRMASHEFIITLQNIKKAHNVTAMDFAKRLLDFGFHAPTTYFPLLVPECFLIEPTETESKQTLDAFVKAMCAVKKEVESTPEIVLNSPHTLPVKRLDDVRAVRELNVNYYAEK